MAQARGDAGIAATIFRLAHKDARKDGLFVLDGDVLERYGFGHTESQRVHLSLMSPPEMVEKGETYLKLDGASTGVQQLAQVVDPADPEVQRLFAELQSAVNK